MKNLYAYTEPGSDYPAYISINDMGVGQPIRLTVREQGNGGRTQASIDLTPEQLEHLATELIARLNGA